MEHDCFESIIVFMNFSCTTYKYSIIKEGGGDKIDSSSSQFVVDGLILWSSSVYCYDYEQSDYMPMADQIFRSLY